MTKTKKRAKVAKVHKPKRKTAVTQKKQVEPTSEQAMDEAVKVYEPALKNLAKTEPKTEEPKPIKAAKKPEQA
jgi:hypothetical protein